MLYLIPRPLHRLALRVAHRGRHWLRLVLKPHLHGVSVLAFDGEGRLLLVRHSYGPDAWAVPGGGCKRSEAPDVTARRELMEELGVEIARLILVAAIEETISGSPHTAHIFEARLSGEVRPDRREILEARYFALDQLPDGMSRFTRHRIALWLERADQS